MRNAAMTFGSVILGLSLSACAAMQQPSVPGSAPAIQRNLSPICPTPSNFTAEQSELIAEALDHLPPNVVEGVELLAIEWDRLDTAARLCRGD